MGGQLTFFLTSQRNCLLIHPDVVYFHGGLGQVRRYGTA